MNIKSFSFAGLATALALQLCPPVAADPVVVAGSAAPNLVIPDNNLNGIASTISLPNTFGDITSVSVTLDIVGAPCAYDGDYYAYLQFGSTLVTLMSNPGTSVSNPWGSPNDGMDVTFTESAATSINAAFAPDFSALSGSYLPQNSLAAFNSATPSGSSGNWTLFIADTSPGGVGELAGWGLTVTGVAPDKTSTALLLVMGLGSLGLISMRQRATARISRK